MGRQTKGTKSKSSSSKKQKTKSVGVRPTKKREYKLMTNPPEPLTWQILMNWLSDTGWVEGFIGKRISPLDRLYFADYVQECWVQILEVPQDKMMEIWYRGKGKFVNYIKSIIVNNIYSKSSHCFKNIREAGKHEMFLTDEQWIKLDNCGESTFDETFAINDFDNNNTALHFGVDTTPCKVLNDEYRITDDDIQET